MTTPAAITSLRDSLGAIPGVVSCRIGIEPGISPADYPLVRIVPSRLTPGRPYGGRTAELLVYFGADASVSTDGLEAVYSTLFDLERAIIDRVKAAGGRYVQTLTDEDRLDTFKLMTVRAELPIT